MQQISKTIRRAPLRTSTTAAGLLMLAACASAPPLQVSQETPHAPDVANQPSTSNVTVTSPGYVALKEGDNAKARDYIKMTNAERPNDAFDELNLGASYQRLGQMSVAEPFYRQAMTHGHGLHVAETTRGGPTDRTVEEIACNNLSEGLQPATIAGTARPCQTTLFIAVADSRARHEAASFNTYFEFDKASLTPDGHKEIAKAAKQALSNPKSTVNLVGKASNIGPASYNWELSHQRAITVRDELIADGLPGSRINVRWVGETELPAPQAPGVHEPLNRVVEGVVKK